MSRFLSGASVVVCACSAAATALAGSPQLTGGPNQFHSLIEAVSADATLADYAIIENESGVPPADSKVRPEGALLAQEADAAALYSGRNFLALGRRRDDRANFRKIASGETDTPDGWKRGYRGGDERLVHLESGLECPLEYDVTLDENRRALSLYGITQYDRRGRDVSCNYSIEGEASITVYASFYPDLSLEDHAGGAASAIHQTFQVKGNLPIMSVKMRNEGADAADPELPPAVSGAFDIGEINGVPYKTAVWIGKTHGWHVKTRATYPQSDMIAEITGAILFQSNFINVDKKNRKNPTAAGVEA